MADADTEKTVVKFTPVIDARKMKTRDVLLDIIRRPYEVPFKIKAARFDGDKFVSRLRTNLTRVRKRVKASGGAPKPVTLNVIEQETLEDCDLIQMVKHTSRSPLVDQLAGLVSELDIEDGE